jgi:hypothetical protein
VQYVFLNYSVTYSTTHVRHARFDCRDWLLKTTQLCDIGDGLSSTWFSLFLTSSPLPLWQIFSFKPSRQTALYCSAFFGLNSETRFLLESGVCPISLGSYFDNALQIASYGGYRDVVETLLESGADSSMKGGRHHTALEAACKKGHLPVIERLLSVFYFLLGCIPAK